MPAVACVEVRYGFSYWFLEVSPLFIQVPGGQECRALRLSKLWKNIPATSSLRHVAMDLAGLRDCDLR